MGWNGKQLGQFRGWEQVIAPEGDPTRVAGTSLFCINVISPPKGATTQSPATNDQTLVDWQRKMHTGIFDCDEHKVFYAGTAQTAEWKSIANTDIFIGMWRQLKNDTRFSLHDWTVKVDPDAVFFPHRLRSHLKQLRPPQGEPIYIKNCDFKFGFMGSLEIFSRKAMEVFFRDGWQCESHIGHTGGEDFYMMTCMDALGVGNMADASILDDKYTRLDKLILQDVKPCYNGWTSAFHPYKDLQTFEKCHGVAWDAEKQFL